MHSPFSRGTSPKSTLYHIAAWAGIKGIHLVGTGDFTHPGWFEQLKSELLPAEPGFFSLRGKIPDPMPDIHPPEPLVRFILSAEISCIYKRGGKTRKVHNLIYVPSLDSAMRINRRLSGLGNIVSDGRPILGLDSRDLLEIVLEAAPEGFLVPAHIWTPWFSIFGSRSGFDSVEECFGDLSSHIFALETGLSSDPGMNRLISWLDRYSLISNSDSHSPQKIGREANLFNTGFDYFSLLSAIKRNNRAIFPGTVEFFAEEGKYHSDGHRACNLSLPPYETEKLGGVCPVCSKPLTVGVLNRIMKLADRENPVFSEESPRFFSLVPLVEILGEILGVGAASKKVAQQYEEAISLFGSELDILIEKGIDEIAAFSPLLGEAVSRMRRGEVIKKAGFDGEYGRICLFGAEEISRLR